MSIRSVLFREQECIGVGYVPPARNHTGGIPDREQPWTETPGQRPPLDRDSPLDRDPMDRQSPPLDRDPLDKRPPSDEDTRPGQRPPCRQTDICEYIKSQTVFANGTELVVSGIVCT